MMRPTWRGVGVLVTSVLVGVGGWFLGWPPMVGAGVAGAALFLIALLLVAGGRVGEVDSPPTLRIERRSGEDAIITISGSKLLGRAAVRIRHRREVIRCYRAPRGNLAAVLRVETNRRGSFVLGPWVLERIDPWALVTRRLGSVSAIELLVIPRIHKMHADTVPNLLSERGRVKQGSSSLATLREYVIGDELRQVHWRSTAKTGALMVRQYVDVTRPVLIVVVDMDLTHYTDVAELDDAVDLAASIAASAVGMSVEVRTTTGDRAEILGANPTAMLNMLARASSEPGILAVRRGTVIRVGPELLAQHRGELQS